MNPFISAHLLLYSFPHPFSILVILVFVLRNSVSLLAFFKTFVLSSPVQSPLSQNLPSFLRNTFRIPFIVPLKTQRTPEGGKLKHCSKLSSDVVLWERELRQSNESDNFMGPVIYQRLCTYTFVTSVPFFFSANFPSCFTPSFSSLNEEEDRRGCCDISAGFRH